MKINLLNFLQRKIHEFPNIKQGDIKLDIVPIGSVQRCAGEMTETNPGSSNVVTDTLMFPSFFKNKKHKKVKK